MYSADGVCIHSGVSLSPHSSSTGYQKKIIFQNPVVQSVTLFSAKEPWIQNLHLQFMV